MRISLIVAASANHVIGVRGKLPWHLPNDFKYFKQNTLGKPVVMGRHTWDSIGRALPDRHNIVITRQADFVAQSATVAASRAQVLEAAGDADELMIIGGAQIYQLFFELATRIYLTRVNAEVDGDTFFPQPDLSQWSLRSCDAHAADERHAFDYEFRVYDRL
ncbi:MAG: type 3 dihydrofolate reductase [Gammaproteobacteria bacterium]|nr:type 3 dihydrofolate reductase [Gammaproteobacteria bacterium]